MIPRFPIVNDSDPGLFTVGFNSNSNSIRYFYDSLHYNFLSSDWELNLMKSSEAMGCRGIGVMPLEMVAVFADNAGSAMLASPMRVGELLIIRACILAAVGECSTIYY